MVFYNKLKCPKCGGDLKYYNTIKRIKKTKGGKKEIIRMRQYICRKCKSTHRELPPDILPYKHYELSIIKGVVVGKITSYDLDYEDYPCEMTMNRWKKEYCK